MNYGIELNLKQTLKLTLTPELRQSINILQYSSLELIEFLQQKVVENPILEIKDHWNVPDSFVSNNYVKTTYSSFNDKNDYNPINHYSDTHITLEKHLTEQINTLRLASPLQKRILKFLVSHLDDHGFLEIDINLIAHAFSVSLEEAEKSLHILQTLDPIGVGARNLAECLLIQLGTKSHPHPLAYPLIENHLEDLAEKRYRKLSTLFSVSLEEVQEAADFIKTLNPRPCCNFYNGMTQYIKPDVIVENVKNEYIIIVNDSIMPTLAINEFYKKRLKNEKKGEARDFLKEKYHEAMILLNGIEQRKMTLYKVTRAIVDKQPDFLQVGMAGLKPMTLRDISEQLGLHESTVSRATSNKYIQTQHGLFKLKNLFTKGISTTNRLEDDSSATVKEKIRALIDKENKRKPLSDQKIAEQLEEKGVLISRRTVAKYREELGILSSAKRRRF